MGGKKETFEKHFTVYSLRMMSMAKGGCPLQLGSIVRLDPLFMLAAVDGFTRYKCNFQLSLSSAYIHLWYAPRIFSAKVQKTVLRVSTHKYLRPSIQTLEISGPASSRHWMVESILGWKEKVRGDGNYVLRKNEASLPLTRHPDMTAM